MHDPDSRPGAPAVLYGAKSTIDPNLSIPDQLLDGHEMARENGWHVVGDPFSDENFSAYSGNRGPGLEAAKRAAIAAAKEYGRPCMLIAQAHDRFARGAGDRPGAPQSLGELWHELRRQDVWLRTVEDDEELRDPAAVAAIGQRAFRDSKRKSVSVRKGMARRAAKGMHMPSRGRYGFVLLKGGDGKLLPVPAEAAVTRRMLAELLTGRTMSEIARGLTFDGVKTARGGEWRQATVSRLLRSPAIAGLGADGEPCPCGHEAIVDAVDWRRAQDLLDQRAKGEARGRQPGTALFRKGMLRCGCCGAAMVARPGKGDSGPAYYCMTRKQQTTAACPMPNVSAAAVDFAVLQHFRTVGVDVEATRRAWSESQAARVATARALRDDAERSEQRAAERLARVRRDYQDGELSAADWGDMRTELEAERSAAAAEAMQHRSREAELSAESAGRDWETEVLRYLAGWRESIVVEVRDQATLQGSRAALLRLFDGFTLHHTATMLDAAATERLPELLHAELVMPGGVIVEPHVRENAIAARAPEGSGVELHRVPLALSAEKERTGLGL